MNPQSGSNEFQLVHMNVVRPVEGFNARHPTILFFFDRFQKLLPVAKADEGLKWHNHGARMPDGRFIDLPELVALDTQSMEENPHVLTMAGWRDAAALKAFAYRSPIHAEGIKVMRDWVDKSQGPTMVLWWWPKGKRVSLEDGWSRVERLRRDGPTHEAFTLRDFRDPA